MSSAKAAKAGFDVRSMKLGIDSFFGFAGFSLFVAVVLSFYLYAPETLSAHAGAFNLRLVGALSAMMAYAVMYLTVQPIMRVRCIPLVVVALVGCAAFGIAMLAPAGDPKAWVVLFACASAGIAALACLWFSFLSMQPGGAVLFFVAVGVSAGVALCLVARLLDGLVLRMSMTCLWFASVACFGALVRINPKNALPVVVPNKESDRRSKIMVESMLMLSFSCFELGFAISAVGSVEGALACLGTGCAVAVVMSVDAANSRRINERNMLPFTTPLTVLSFMAMFLFGEVGRVAALCMLTALVVIYMVLGWAALTEHVLMCKLSPLRTYAKARLIDYAGLSVGLACGYVASALFSKGGMEAARVSLVVAVAYCFLAAFCHKPRFPEAGVADEENPSVPEGKGLWRRRCRAVSEEYGLSERQYEVLVLVAQGRSAKYIEQALTISLSTAQTHIRNIYRKMGVHSRQELLNLIENTKLYGED